MSFAIERLDRAARAPLLAHLLALPAHDRMLRFGTAVAPQIVAGYVEHIDFDRDALFGVHDARHVLVGTAHVALEDGEAEVALSVLPQHRRQGIGSALVARAIGHALSLRVPKLIMQFLSGNGPIMRIAKRFGMSVVASRGSARAQLNLPVAAVPAAPVETHWTRILHHDLLDAHGNA
jgi:GNAT superfamily N-acetyltransferase